MSRTDSSIDGLGGRTAIVTGAARGMGAAAAGFFAEQGTNVILCDVLEDLGKETAYRIGPKATFRLLDVADEDSWIRVVRETHQKFGSVDILLNNAALVYAAAAEDAELAQIRRVMDVNVIGHLLGAKHVIPIMKQQRRGVILNVSSAVGLTGCNGLTAYSASKFAVRGLTRSLALELGPYGIRVCAIHPGGMNTVMNNPAGLKSEELKESYRETPLQRIGEAEEVARVAVFLASDAASYLTGAEIPVDGGRCAGMYEHLLPGAPPK